MTKIFIGLLAISLALLAAIGSKKYRDLQAPGERPQLDIEAYWGPKIKEPYRENPEIVSFDISVKPEVR